MKHLLLIAAMALGWSSASARADVVPQCGPGQHWAGGHGGHCSCAVSPGPSGSGGAWLGLLLAGGAVIVARRRALSGS
ncbi:MAG TPA: hypothetical protein ENK57_08225 [Polyangiaceae bacterium]|nr:hypothetical protein [Polyangiaceae bacterium]